MTRVKKLVQGLALFLAASVASGAAVAQDFPSQPIKVIVPFAAGGLTDAFARAMARIAQDHLPNKQPIIIVNKPGGGSVIGVTDAFSAEPDGHTIAFVTSSAIVIQPHYGKTDYKATDFQPILHVYDIPNAITVQVDSELKTYADWEKWVRANPGGFTYGTSSGAGGVTHVLAEKFAAAAGIDIRYVPFEGSAPLTAAIMGGQVMGGVQLPDFHSGGETRPLVFVTKSKPTDPMYDAIPTAADLGIDAMATVFSGLIGNKNIPADRIAILHDAFAAAMADPVVQQLFVTYSLEPSTTTNAEFADIISYESDENSKMLKKLGLIN